MYSFQMECPACGKHSVVKNVRRVPAPHVNCGDCLMDRTEVVPMLVTSTRIDFAPTVTRLRELAEEVDALKSVFDLEGATCTSCGSFRYELFPQKMVFDRVVGAAERLRQIAETLDRRQNDNDFNPVR